MMRSLPAVAVGAAVALLAVVVLLALRPTAETVDQRGERLAAELRCPDCQGLSVADSPTEAAAAIRVQIDELLAAGASDDAVRAHFVSRYGDWILLAPRAPAFWLLPLVIVAAAMVWLVVWLRRRPTTEPEHEARLDAEERRRLRDELEALDA